VAILVTEIDDVDRVAGLLLTQDPDEVFGGAHGLSVERGDHIAGFEASIVRGTVPGDGEDDDAALLAGTELFLDLARERLGLNAEEGVLRLPRCQELLDDVANRGRGCREAQRDRAGASTCLSPVIA